MLWRQKDENENKASKRGKERLKKRKKMQTQIGCDVQTINGCGNSFKQLMFLLHLFFPLPMQLVFTKIVSRMKAIQIAIPKQTNKTSETFIVKYYIFLFSSFTLVWIGKNWSHWGIIFLLFLNITVQT